MDNLAQYLYGGILVTEEKLSVGLVNRVVDYEEGYCSSTYILWLALTFSRMIIMIYTNNLTKMSLVPTYSIHISSACILLIKVKFYIKLLSS